MKRPRAPTSGPDTAVARMPFVLQPVDLLRRNVQQLVLQLVFSGEGYDSARCEWRSCPPHNAVAR